MRKIILSALILISLVAQPTHDDWDRDGRKAMLIWKMTEHLDLTEEQAETFFPKFRIHEHEMEKLEKNTKKSLESISIQLQDDKDVSAKELEKVLREYKDIEKQKIDLKFDFINSLSGTLSSTQQAKLVLLPGKMRQDAKENIRKHKKFRNKRYEKDRW